jgi:hypothetical protein
MGQAKCKTGGCLCGAIRYEFAGEPVREILCHCRMCQRFSGAPFLAFRVVPKEALRITKGEPAIYYTSSARAERHFCPRCGSTLFYVPQRARFLGIAIGSSNAPEDFAPSMQLNAASGLGWVKLQHEAPRLPGMAPGGPAPLDYDPFTGEASLGPSPS